MKSSKPQKRQDIIKATNFQRRIGQPAATPVRADMLVTFAAVGMLALTSLAGCASTRPAQTTLEPTYSILRDEPQVAANQILEAPVIAEARGPRHWSTPTARAATKRD